MHRGSWRYRRRQRDEAALRARLRELAAERPRFGYRRLYIVLRREKGEDGTSWRVNHKRSVSAVPGGRAGDAAEERVTVLGLNQNHNHDLKNIFKSAAISASTRPGPFQEFYAALLAKGGGRRWRVSRWRGRLQRDILCLKPRRALDDAMLARARNSKPAILEVLRQRPWHVTRIWQQGLLFRSECTTTRLSASVHDRRR